MQTPRLALILAGALVLATSGPLADPALARAPSKKVAPTPPAASDRPAPAAPKCAADMQVEATYGQLPAAEVEALVQGRMPQIKRCFDEVAGRLWFLSGALTLRGRVARDGSVKSVALTRSTIGSHEVERCIVKVIKDLKMPPPQGGEGEFTYPLEFTPSDRARGVATWPEAQVAADFARHRGEITTCQHRRRPLQVTVYIGPGGKVAAAGFGAEDPLDDAVVTCLLRRVSGWTLPDPLGQLVKASYAF